MTDFLENFVRVSESTRCPVCGRSDWCAIQKDGRLVICQRVPSDEVWVSGFVHYVDTAVPLTPIVAPPPKAKPEEIKAVWDHLRLGWTATWAKKWADHLKVSISGLKMVGAVPSENGIAFPMFGVSGEMLGLRYRSWTGKKWSYKGGREGIFGRMDDGRTARRIYICEGPTDAAALYSVGLVAFGRPTCRTGDKIIKEWADRYGSGSRAVIIADRDKHGAGQDGARRLADTLGTWVESIVIPKFHKDVRDMLSYFRSPENGRDAILNVDPEYLETLTEFSHAAER